MNDTLDVITIPSTLKVVEPNVFEDCGSVRRVEFIGMRRALREDAGVWGRLFRDCEVEEIVLPGALREVDPVIFKDCRGLKTVWVANGCSVDVGKLVGSNVKVQEKRWRRNYSEYNHV